MRPLFVLLALVAIRPLCAAVSSGMPTLPCDSGIASAAAYSRKCGGEALIVMEGGRTIHESYAHGGAPDRPIHVMSITKNLALLAVLAARNDGILKLDEPVARTISEWRDKPGKREVTISELLQQVSGLAPGYDTIYAHNVRNKNKIAVSLPLEAEPGSQFRYAPSNYELIEELLRRKLATRGATPLGYLKQRILTPLGVRPAEWRCDRSGNPFFSAGAHLTARDVAKIGEFIRTKGRVWLLPLLPATVFGAAFTGTPANSMYGLSFWLNANRNRPGADPISIEDSLGNARPSDAWSRSSICSVAPDDLIAMVGSGGERCYVVPSCKLVVVRFGKGSNFSDAEFLRRLFGRG